MAPGDAARLFGVRQAGPTPGAAVGGGGVGGGWGAADGPAALPEDLDLCEVDRRGADLPAAEFEADYLLASRPVVVEGGAERMVAKRTWARGEFFRRAGHTAFAPQKLPMWTGELLATGAGGEEVTLGAYFEELAAGKHPRPLAWNTPRNHTLWAQLEAELAWPMAMRAPSVRRVGAVAGYFGLFMGPQGSGTSMHHHKAAWNALLFGRKLWLLTPPAQSAFRRGELAADSFAAAGQGWLAEATRRARGGEAAEATAGRRWLFVVQREGDVLFVPQGWGHATLNLRESIGVANFFLDEDAVGYRPSKMFHAARGLRSLQTAAGMASPSDFDPDGHP
jgi:hypothetical protein